MALGQRNRPQTGYQHYNVYAKSQRLIANALQGPASQGTRAMRSGLLNMRVFGSIPVAGATYYTDGYTQPAQVFTAPTPLTQSGAPASTSAGIFSFPSPKFTGPTGAIPTYLSPVFPGSKQ
jgi:hypothetical protein